jgi:hypothetical protein
MENVINKRCEEEGCETLPSYGKEWQKPTHCVKHASEDMENVINKRCEEEGCKIQPHYGKEWKKPTHCVKHASRDMENVTNKRCEKEGCKISPCHENLCFAHWVESHKDDPDFKIKRHALIKQKACINDFIPTFVEDLNVNYNIEKTVHFEGKQRRLDCEMYDDETTLDIECDEYQHKHKKDEQERTKLISNAYKKPIIMVRLNPDDYKANRKHVTGCWNGKKEDGCPRVPECQEDNWKHRLEVLEETIKLCFSGKPFAFIEKEFENNDEKQTERFENILIIKLFYDKK